VRASRLELHDQAFERAATLQPALDQGAVSKRSFFFRASCFCAWKEVWSKHDAPAGVASSATNSNLRSTRELQTPAATNPSLRSTRGLSANCQQGWPPKLRLELD